MRRIVRSHTPMISAASSQVILFAMAFKITSCSFIIRSSSAAEIAWLVSNPKRLHPLFQKRTDTVLIQPDKYRANDIDYARITGIPQNNGREATSRDESAKDTPVGSLTLRRGRAVYPSAGALSLLSTT